MQKEHHRPLEGHLAIAYLSVSDMDIDLEPKEGPSPYSSSALDAANNFMEVRAPKRARTAAANPMPSSVICALANEAGDTVGQHVELPVTSTSKQLQQLLNSLLENEDKVLRSKLCIAFC